MKFINSIKNKLHRCRYKIIGFGNSGNMYFPSIQASPNKSINVDLICNNCGKVITVYVPNNDKMVTRVIHTASNNKYFNINKKYIYYAHEIKFDKL